MSIIADTKVREYWEQRAVAMPTPNATTDDVWLRELEVRTLADALKALPVNEGARILDVGCGDGHTTLRLADEFPGCSIQGVDYSQAMVGNAERNLAARPGCRVAFDVGDVERLPECYRDGFDVAITVRCLINLADDAQQAKAMGEIAKCVRAGGMYVAIENFREGHEAMNAARAGMGLDAIPLRWHNHYFTEQSFRKAVEPWFENVELRDFSSSYYLATRVLYSAWCAESGQAIDYNHALHRLAVALPPSGGFSPVRLAILRRRSP